MSSSTGIPTSTGSGRGEILQPKMQFRFRVTFDQFGGGNGLLVTEQVLSVTRPSVSFRQVPVNGAYRAESPKWDDITLVIRDDVRNNAATAINAQFHTQKNDPYKTFDMNIETLDDDKVIEIWRCENCFMRRIDNGLLSYRGGSELQITLTIKSRNIRQHFPHRLAPLPPDYWGDRE